LRAGPGIKEGATDYDSTDLTAELIANTDPGIKIAKTLQNS
jgi:hypothetical protein